ncbi:histidine kinase dimerization/phosphoacceptor domain-containing protein [Streptomyces sp. M10(2022)]
MTQRRPEEAEDALRVIEQTGRAAMTEMRRTLGVLRAGSPSAPLGPAPGVDALGGLADQARRAGVDVDLTFGCRTAVCPRAWPWPSTGSFRSPSPTR